MDFVRSYFGTNEPLTSWTLFSHFLARSAKKWGKKCSTGQRFICTIVTSYKIHINYFQEAPFELHFFKVFDRLFYTAVLPCRISNHFFLLKWKSKMTFWTLLIFMENIKYITFIRLNLIFLSNKPYFVIKKTER